MSALPHILESLPKEPEEASQPSAGEALLRRRLRVRAEEARSILVVVRAYSEALESRYQDQDFRAEIRDVMRESTERLTAALDEIEGLKG
jgi:hypothetical protein